ncbi:Ig-like domain-containing protein [Clostridium ljungdahlii]|uniref:Ig-like domain-containing protein n=1 Tax=Clostridium ljungdahlii TaxID=1538 RepID=UPI00386F31DF
MVTGINEGSCNIDITYHGDYDTSSTSINIEVAAVAEHNYVISVSPDNILLDIGKIQQIISSVTDKGTAISSPTLTYSSDNTAVATVNNTGLVTGISVGTANITVSYVGEDGNTYSKTIPIVINAVVAKTIAITSTATNPNKIKVNNTQNYTITETSNENIVNDTFTLTESGCDPSYYSLTVIDNNNFSITNLKGDGTEYLTITVTSATNATVSGSIKIRLAGRW